MIKSLSLIIAFILTLQSIPLAFASEVRKTDDLIIRLQNLTHNFDTSCAPKGTSNIEAHFLAYGMSESCWKIITEINHLEKNLSAIHPQLASQVSCATGNCLKNITPIESLPTLPLPPPPTCSASEKQQVIKDCPGDLGCALVSTATTLPIINLEIISPQKLLPKGFSSKACNGNDSCTNQLITSFFNSIMKFFQGAWDMLKSAGNFAKNKIGDFWKWVTEAEDSSSTAQLALAKASEDESLFQMLKNDFSGTVSRIFQTLIVSVKEWLKNDIFCERWQARPHLSQCLTPAQSFDCVSCKSMLNGVCALGGAFVSEILPAFISGGLLTAAKHGVGAASRIAQTSFKFSDKTIQSIKSSKTVAASFKVAAHADEVTKVSVVLSKINKYFLSPARKVAKVSFGTLSTLARNSKTFIAQTSSGKYIVFAQDGLKLAGKIVLYPIENNMTVLAFKTGQQTFDKAFKLAAPSLVNKTTVGIAVTAHAPALDSVLTKIEINKIKNMNTLSLELEQVKLLAGSRKVLTEKALSADKPKFSEIIRTLYPELSYGDLARKIEPAEILKREKELFTYLSTLKDPELKKSMLTKYQGLIVESKQRKMILKDMPNHKEIIENSRLSSLTRGARGIKLLNKHPSAAQRKKLEAAIVDASSSAWKKKKEILLEAGFTEVEAQKLMRYGMVGFPPN